MPEKTLEQWKHEAREANELILVLKQRIKYREKELSRMWSILRRVKEAVKDAPF